MLKKHRIGSLEESYEESGGSSALKSPILFGRLLSEGPGSSSALNSSAPYFLADPTAVRGGGGGEGESEGERWTMDGRRR